MYFNKGIDLVSFLVVFLQVKKYHVKLGNKGGNIGFLNYFFDIFRDVITLNQINKKKNYLWVNSKHLNLIKVPFLFQ